MPNRKQEAFDELQNLESNRQSLPILISRQTRFGTCRPTRAFANILTKFMVIPRSLIAGGGCSRELISQSRPFLHRISGQGVRIWPDTERLRPKVWKVQCAARSMGPCARERRGKAARSRVESRQSLSDFRKHEKKVLRCLANQGK